MNRYIFSFPMLVILLFSGNALSQQSRVKKLISDGHAATVNIDCPRVLETLGKLVTEHKHLENANENTFKYANKWVDYCEGFKVIKTTRRNSGGFELHTQDLNAFWPPSLSSGTDHQIVKSITDKLDIAAIKVYDILGMAGAFAVKPVPGATPAFEKAPNFEGIIVDSKYMDIRVDVTAQEITDMIEWERDVVAFIEHGRQRRYGLLAHEVAHMLLPSDIRFLIGEYAQNPNKQVDNPRVSKILKNLQDAISSKRLDLSSQTKWQFADEMVADYVAGGILAFIGIGDDGVEYMLNMHKLAGSKGNSSHLPGDERARIFEMGYKDRSVE